MKVLHVISSTNATFGGPVEGLKQIAKSLAPLGVEVEVLSLDDPDNSPWIKDFPLVVHATGPGHGKFGQSAKTIDWLKEHGKNYDRIVVNGIWQFNGMAVWQTRQAHGRPYVVFTHGMLDPWFRRTYPLKHLKKQIYWLTAQHAVLKNAAAVLYTCEEEKQLAQNAFVPWGPYQERVVAYGTAGSPYALEEVKETFLTAFPQLRNKRIVLFLSRIHEKKGCDLLIKAFAKHAKEDPNLVLVVAGPDETGWKATLEQIAQELGIADQVVWPGMLKNEMKWGAYASAEAFALSSHQENFGIVVAEALSAGVPVLISNKVNIWREIESDGAGIVGDDTLEGTDKTLTAWFKKSEAERIQMGQAARQCFLNRFEIGHAAKSLLAVYQSIESPS